MSINLSTYFYHKNYFNQPFCIRRRAESERAMEPIEEHILRLTKPILATNIYIFI